MQPKLRVLLLSLFSAKKANTAMIFLLLGFLLLSFQSSAQLIRWELSNNPGNQLTNNSSANATGINVGVLSRGEGVTPATAANSMNSANWANGVFNKIDNDYYQFTVPVSSNYSANITTIRIALDRSSQGPINAILRSSLDDYTSNYALSVTGTEVVSVPENVGTFTFDINETVTNSVTFRLYGYSASNSGTNSQMSIGAFTGDEIIVNGSTTFTANTAPTLDNIEKSGNEDVTVSFSSSDFTDAFHDGENNSLSKIKITSLPTNGTLRLGENNVTLDQEIPASLLATLNLVPELNYNSNTGVISFSWKGFDGTVYSAAAANVNITLVPVNDAPLFTKGADQTNSEDDGSITVPGWATSISDGDPDLTQSLTFNVSNNNNDIFSVQPIISAGGILSYTLADNAHGAATVTVTLSDIGSGTSPNVNTSASQTFTITVTAVNDVPVATAQSITTAEDTPKEGTLAGTDVEGSTLTFAVTQPAHGSVTVDANTGAFTYTPAANYNGADAFTFTVSDGDLTSEAATVSITVTAVNDVPSFEKGTDQTVSEDAATQTITGWATSISTGPANESSQTVDFIVTNNNNGLFAIQPSISPAGILTYTLAANQNGSAIVSVKIKDNGGTANGGIDVSGVQTFNINVTPVNDAPELTDVPATVTKAWNEEVTFDANASDIDNTQNELTYSLVGAPTGATIDGATGVFSWTPTAAQRTNSPYTFQVVVSDGGLTAQATIEVTVDKRKTKIKYNGATNVNYSDPVDLKASLEDFSLSTPISGKTVGFTFGSQSASDTYGGQGNGTDAVGLGEATLVVTQQPNVYTITTSFAGDNHYYGSSDNTSTLSVGREDLCATYNGFMQVAATSTGKNSCKASFALSVGVSDLDGYGDVTKLQVKFTINGTTTYTVPVQSLNSTNTEGNATKLIDFAFNGTYATIDIKYDIISTYYQMGGTSPCDGDGDVTVNLYLPQNEFITGGGFVRSEKSAGLLPAEATRKANFGFNVKYTKSGTNLQGNINYIFRRLEDDGIVHVYQVKGNAMTTLTVDANATPRVAVFNGKCNVADITENPNPLVPLKDYLTKLGGTGNSTMQVLVSDGGEPGTQVDAYAITVWNSKEQLFHSSNWISTQTVKQVLSGGNIQVSGTTSIAATQQVVTEARTEVIEPVNSAFQLKAFPNPSVSHFNVQVSSDKVGEKINVRVLDLYGRTVEVIQGVNSGQTLRLGGAYRPGIYFVEMIQGEQRQQIKLMKQGD